MPKFTLNGTTIDRSGVSDGKLVLNTISGVDSFSYSYFNGANADIFIDIEGDFSLKLDGGGLNEDNLIFAFSTLKWGSGQSTKLLIMEANDAFFLAPIAGDTLVDFYRDNGHALLEFEGLVTGAKNISSGALRPNKDIALDTFVDGDFSGAIKYGNQNNNTLNGSSKADVIVGLKGKDVLNGKAGGDTLMLGRSNDEGYGGAGGDIITGYIGNDLIWGQAGSDTLLGGADDDKLSGGKGKDQLSGGRDKDRLDGGQGDDKLTGGKGADVFVFANNGDTDRIKDFAKGADQIKLNDNLWNGNLSAQDVVDQFAEKTGGNIVFDFGGGDKLVLEDYTKLGTMADFIDII